MFIQTEDTPNPNTIKFIPGREVLKDSTAQFNDIEQAKKSPLALSLFAIKNVQSVFLGSDFISVTKASKAKWDIVKTEILTTIMEHFTKNLPVMAGETTATAAEDVTLDVSEEDKEIAQQIKELIDNRVRPAVAQDGGDIIFKGYKSGTVKLELHGACSGCPSSTITLKDGIENMLKHYIPEVENVEAVSN